MITLAAVLAVVLGHIILLGTAVALVHLNVEVGHE